MSDSSILEAIRAAARELAASARFVRLQEDQIEPYASSMRLATRERPIYDAEHHLVSTPAETAAYLLALDSVNFGSGYFPHLWKRERMSGYFTIASSLKDRWTEQGPLTGAALRDLRLEECAAIFGQIGNAGPIEELMALFARALNDLGQWLGRDYDDDPLAPIAAAGGSAARLVSLLSGMPLFRDITPYGGRHVPLFKRAQLLAADLSLAFEGRGPGGFHDLDRLTIFADNLVPHVLRVDGVLAYEPELLARINDGTLIPAGSPEEVEIRAVALHAVERIVDALRETGIPATSQQLDYLLWTRGQGKRYKSEPRHRTRSVYY